MGPINSNEAEAQRLVDLMRSYLDNAATHKDIVESSRPAVNPVNNRSYAPNRATSQMRPLGREGMTMAEHSKRVMSSNIAAEAARAAAMLEYLPPAAPPQGNVFTRIMPNTASMGFPLLLFLDLITKSPDLNSNEAAELNARRSRPATIDTPENLMLRDFLLQEIRRK